MALDRKMSTATVNAQASALGVLCNSGYIDIYDGAKPASANTAITTEVKLARLTFGATAFGAASVGTIIANAITSDTSAVSGIASWARVVTGAGVELWDDTVASADSNIVLNSTSIGAGATVSITSLNHTVPKA